MSRASCGRSLLKTSMNLSNLACCCRKLEAAGLVAGFSLQGQMHALMAAVLLRMTRLDPFNANTEPEPPDRKFAQVQQGMSGSEGHAVVAADVDRPAALLKKPLKHRESIVFPGRRKSLTGEEKTAGMVGDRQRIAVLTIGEQELALVIGAPQ